MNKATHSVTQAYQRASEHALKEKLILDHLDYARKIVSTLTVGLPKHVDRENLEQAGLTGLVEAARHFDVAMGVKFRTFAYQRIRGAVIDEMRKNSLVPQQMIEQIDRLKQVYNQLQAPVTPEMLAAKAGLPIAEVLEILEAMRFMQPQSWNDLVCHIHASWKHQAESPEAELEAEEMRKIVADAIEQLPERERLVVTLYYAEDLTLAEIGEVLGLSESRVSRVLASATFRLKEKVRHDTQ